MAAVDQGTQNISIKFNDNVDSRVVNKMTVDIIPTGIYSGGICARVSDSSVSISPFVCEISDGSYQARIATTVSYTLTSVSDSTPYIVCSWDGSQALADDYMTISSKAVPLENDLVICKAIYSGGVMTGIEYGDAINSIYRSVPPAQDTWLKPVIHPTNTGLLFVQGGWLMGATVPAFIAPTEITMTGRDNGTYYVYVDVVAGQSDVTDVIAMYTGKVVLAIVNWTSPALTYDDVIDTRSFLTPVPKVDGTTIAFDANGAISTANTPTSFQWGTFVGSDTVDVTVTLPFIPRYIVAWNDSQTVAGSKYWTWIYGLKDGVANGLLQGDTADIEDQAGRLQVSSTQMIFTKDFSSLNKEGAGNYNVFWMAMGNNVETFDKKDSGFVANIP